MFEWIKNLFASKKPKAKLDFDDGKLIVKSYNKAFVDKIRDELGGLSINKTDAEVVKLYSDRENTELEEPRLTVEHMGIDESGKIKMKLDWNRSFIKLLKDKAGIVAENEEDAIQAYLLKLTMDVAEDMGLPTQLTLTQDQVNSALSQIDGDYDREMRELESMVKNKSRKPRRRRNSNDQNS